ncbi:MAG: four helix bundle protein [Pyrinomonadaceae bacterium]|nr:four helix bundle protein [Pyrinomonadaceae bacterium]
MQDFRNLKVWQKAHELALLTYEVTAEFPREELFGLRNSLRKTAVDIAAAIAEVSGKDSDAEASRTLGYAIALANRLEYFALLGRDLKMINDAAHADYSGRVVEVRKMLSGFSRNLA